MAFNLGMLAVFASVWELAAILNAAMQRSIHNCASTGPFMSKQLTLSATVAVLSMAAFALVSSLGSFGSAGDAHQAAQALRIGYEASR
ncbi:hypothetical protein GRI69_14015 [Erythrobacter vulgaris]|uniref:Uncharacterized protein n=1 Tax=Qipengyuania vulgaris TaxID=291985 RepID=A0A844XTZ6_9SPHN|nr:hypothetical protein [Qipengyuania vulgaris]MXO49371.1 hypothetical protein [Qipengyuania vulgaris]